MNPSPAPIAEALRAYEDCVLRKDATGFAALYDPDVEVFDAWDTWRLEGRAAMQAMASAWFQSLGETRVEVRFSEVHGHAGADVAAVSALVRYTAIAPDGKALRSQSNRMSLVLCRRPEGWRVVHEHTSVPVGFASRQAIPWPAA